MGFIPMSKSFKMRTAFTMDQVSETIKQEAGFQQLNPYFHQSMGATFIYFPAKGQNDIQISTRKDKMFICEAIRPKEALGTVGIDLLTGGWSMLIGGATNDNKKLFEQIYEECKRLFG